MKKIVLLLLLFILVILACAAWVFLGPATKFETSKKTLYIRTNAANKEAVIDSLIKNKIVGNGTAFNFLAGQMNYWKNIKPGKYEIAKGTSLFNLVRMLHNGRQAPVNFTIIKIRTKEDLARMSGNKFEFDSLQMMSFLNNEDSLKKYNTDTSAALSLIIPDTYTFFWNTTPSQVYQKFSDRSKRFWNAERKKQAEDHGLTPVKAYILASIIEEESNNNGEKGNIASVYLNRMEKGMPLQADPTIKFALHDFALRRIYEKYLFVASPYNTYRNKGLPPGPICTPSPKTIDAVL
ncbi:MAG TPA: endolytic transglycosylase MltG, partial [Flavisolibacter sp.]|nr:endolytic transglycosylase MltG [Flavisolibacter sp.]